MSEQEDKSDDLLEAVQFYSYKDLAGLHDEDPSQPLISEDRIATFPIKMMQILTRPELHHIVSWMPHGRSWKVHKQQAFEALVLPQFFDHSRFSSFVRQANGWGFRRFLSRGADQNTYFHERFLRGKPHLLRNMKRPTTRKAHMSPNMEPNFFKISQKSPLSEVQDVQGLLQRLSGGKLQETIPLVSFEVAPLETQGTPIQILPAVSPYVASPGGEQTLPHCCLQNKHQRPCVSPNPIKNECPLHTVGAVSSSHFEEFRKSSKRTKTRQVTIDGEQGPRGVASASCSSTTAVQPPHHALLDAGQAGFTGIVLTYMHNGQKQSCVPIVHFDGEQPGGTRMPLSGTGLSPTSTMAPAVTQPVSTCGTQSLDVTLGDWRPKTTQFSGDNTAAVAGSRQYHEPKAMTTEPVSWDGNLAIPSVVMGSNVDGEDPFLLDGQTLLEIFA